jgi:hypothetical protein
MKKKHLVEARDTGNRGYTLNRLLVEFKLAGDIPEANSMIRSGEVDLDNTKVKDILHFVAPGHYDIRLKGNYAAEVTIL